MKGTHHAPPCYSLRLLDEGAIALLTVSRVFKRGTVALMPYLEPGEGRHVAPCGGPVEVDEDVVFGDELVQGRQNIPRESQ